MAETGRFGAEINSGSGPGTVRKIGTKVGVAFENCIAAVGIVFEMFRHP